MLNSLPLAAIANPVDGVVNAGSATIIENGKKLDVHQHTGKVVIDWRSFDIAPDEHTQFHQPDSSSIALNRVNSNTASNIYGKLTANGNVVIINQNGVLFGAGSQVDVNGLVASTADIDNAKFMNNSKLEFDKAGNPDAVIENRGNITVKQAGLAGFVAPRVANSGVIIADLGRVHLASGDTATVDFYGDGLMKVALSDAVKEQLVSNTGTIEANGGKIALTAAAGKEIVNGIIIADGNLKAKSVGVKNGEIIISGSDKTKIKVNGNIDASGLNAGEKGGKVTITGNEIELGANTKIDASGHAGGGTVLVGGDYKGTGDLLTAKNTKVKEGAVIKANATNSGDGGKVIVWSDVHTDFDGKIEAKALGASGNGGLVETSGKQTLAVGRNSSVVASAVNGNAGVWLLDPYNVTITNSQNGGGYIDGTLPNSTSTILNTNIETALNSGTSVTITTGSTGDPGSDDGDIFVNSAINVNITTGIPAPTLTLSAFRNITVDAAITADSGGNALNVVLNSNNGDESSGAIRVNAGITTNNGNVTMGGGSAPITAGSGYAWGNSAQASGILINNATINAGNGFIIANGRGYNNAAGSTNTGVTVTGASGKLQTSGGRIDVYGIGGNGINTNYGVEINSSGEIRSGNGNIYVEGRGGAGSGNINHGVFVNGASSIIQSTGTGNLTVVGYGGLAGNGSSAVHLVSGKLQTVSGTLDVTGHGGASGNAATNANNNGIYLSGATIASTGIANNTCGASCGKVTVNGTGANGYSGNFGVYLAGNNSIISTVDANLEVIGQGGHGAAGDNAGIRFNANSAAIRSTGTGNVVVQGTGGDGTTNNYGINLTRGSISSASGTLNITGTGGNGSSTGNYGILLSNMVAFINSTGGAVEITATGRNNAVDIHNDGTAATIGGASSGNITINYNTANWGSTVFNIPGLLSLKARTADTDLTLPAITSGVNALYAETRGTGDIILGGNITTTGSGNSIVLNSGSDFKNPGNYSLNPGTGRWVIYSTKADDNTAGGLTAPQTIEGKTYSDLSPTGITGPTYDATQNTFVYSSGGTVIRFIADAITRTYGDANPTFTYTFWCSTGCTFNDAIASGNAVLSTLATQGSNVGDHVISITQGTLTLANDYLGYALEFVNALMTIDPRVITAVLQGTTSKTYDRSTTATLDGTNYRLENIYNGEDVVLNDPTSGTYDDWNAGTGKTVTVNGLVLSGTASGNYVLDSTTITGDIGTINAKQINISGLSVVDKEYDRTTGATLSGTAALSGVEVGDDVSLGGTGSASYANWNAGSNKGVTVTGYVITGDDSGNYTIAQPTGLTGNITQKTLNISANAISTTYGVNPGLTYAESGLISGDSITGSLSRDAGNNVGVYGIHQGTLSAGGNYVISYTGNDYTITPAQLNVVANSHTKNEGAADPALTYSYSGLQYGETSANFTGSLTRAAGEALGNYAITRNNLDVTGNYVIGSFTNGNLLIKAPVTEVPIPTTVQYTTQVPEVKVISNHMPVTVSTPQIVIESPAPVEVASNNPAQTNSGSSSSASSSNSDTSSEADNDNVKDEAKDSKKDKAHSKTGKAILTFEPELAKILAEK